LNKTKKRNSQKMKPIGEPRDTDALVGDDEDNGAINS